MNNPRRPISTGGVADSSGVGLCGMLQTISKEFGEQQWCREGRYRGGPDVGRALSPGRCCVTRSAGGSGAATPDGAEDENSADSASRSM
jgi:hypothetical protein